MSPSATFYLWIALGSGLGGAARLASVGLAVQFFGDGFPWGILIVNIAGSFVIGFFFTFTGLDGRMPASATMRQFVMPGLCGGYTTFSAFSLDTLGLIRDGRVPAACANAGLSVGLCVLVAWLGHALAARLSRPRMAQGG